MDFDQYVAARRVPLMRGAVLLGARESEAPVLVDRLLLAHAGRVRRAADPDALVYAALVAALPGTPAPAPFDEGAGFAVRRVLAVLDPAERALAVLSFHADLVPHDTADALGVTPDEVVLREEDVIAALGARDALHARDLMARAGATVALPPLAPLLPPAPTSRRRATALVLAAGAAVVAAGVTWGQGGTSTREGELDDDQVPSVFGYRVAWATDLLEERGLKVRERMAPSCDPPDVVVGTDPATGATVEPGETVTLVSGFPSGSMCQTRFADRGDAWEFLSFAAGQGPPPAFAERVAVVVDGSDPVALTDSEARVRSRWGDPSVLTAVTDALDEVYDVPGSSYYRTPQLSVATRVPPATTCGVPRSQVFTRRQALVLSLTVPGSSDSLCPLTVDLYRTRDGAVDGVVLHTAGGPAR